MPPFRRAFATFCVLAPLIYIYWRQFTTPGGLLIDATPERIFNKTLGFSKIFVINLPSRTDRRDAMVLAGAVSNLSFSWIDGVTGDQVPDDIFPESDRGHSAGARGSWRSHMNALQTIVDKDLGSALILEDDIDWDIRLKSQLQTFAAASRTWLRESQSSKSEVELLDTTIGAGGNVESVYGAAWDVLWLGHCGADLPKAQKSLTSPLVVTILEDETVPAPQHLKPHPFALQDKLGKQYPPHTRVVHASSGNVCTLAYAVSQEGARKLLLDFNSRYDAQWDLMLQKWCEGTPPTCLTVQPPLFSHYYPKGGASDIQGQGGGYAKGSGSPYIRLSVRENLGRLVTGEPFSQMVDQLPDDGEPI
ncbi:glycosyltransferase family 25 protein [Hypoxylon rubiginosum]|uniref:Glycosyltransferase family 25 protein n=1 Tax=Hypoxylon rubiginosum TaxID=110542 RepID=A0ACC0D9R5_9PEZI|nr:glycosyltransferase family 25 protein [Hypoxylon rubiginosum]